MRLAGVGFSLSEFVHYAGITGQGYFVREYFGNRTRKFFTVLFLPILMMTPQVIEKSALAKEKREKDSRKKAVTDDIPFAHYSRSGLRLRSGPYLELVLVCKC